MATVHENESFAFDLDLSNLLDRSIEWIKDHLEPHEVFDKDALVQWAAEELDQHSDPDDVFTSEELEEWARNNGFVEED